MQGRGAGVRGGGCTSAGRPQTGLFPKLPQQAKSMRTDLGEPMRSVPVLIPAHGAVRLPGGALLRQRLF